MFIIKLKKSISILIIFALGFNIFSPYLTHATFYMSISGKVIDKDTGSGVAGISVIAINKQGENKFRYYLSNITKSDGNYAIEELPSGSYNIEIITNSEYYQVGGMLLNVYEGLNSTEVNIKLVKGGNIIGKILQYDSSTPVENTLVTLFATDESRGKPTLSSKTGNYLIKGIKPTDFAYIIAKPQNGLSSVITTLYNTTQNVIRKGETISLNLTLGNPATRLIGIINDSTGQIMSGVQMMLYSDDCIGESTTDNNGQHEIKGLKAGKYSLLIQKDGLIIYTQDDIQINEGETKVLDITLGIDIISGKFKRKLMMTGVIETMVIVGTAAILAALYNSLMTQRWNKVGTRVISECKEKIEEWKLERTEEDRRRNECYEQYINDCADCQKMCKTPRGKATCYDMAMRRQAACLTKQILPNLKCGE